MHVPGWHEATRTWQQQGRLQLAGIIQEQHPDRARLFMQWKQMGWPLLVDSLNLLEVTAVPITLAIDEHGIIQMVNPRRDRVLEFEENFLNRTFEKPPAGAPTKVAAGGEAARLYLWGGEKKLDRIVASFENEVRRAPDHAPGIFRLGVAYRRRYDSDFRRDGDFQRAVDHWKQALEMDPNQYIWRRRIQQYGPRLDKPYPFYDWVPQARADLRARGESPAALIVEPGGAEFAKPLKSLDPAPVAERPDTRNRVTRDPGRFVSVEITSVPAVLAPGEAARVHVLFRPNNAIKAHWNNEAEDLVFWADTPDGWQAASNRQTVANPKEPVSQETRRIEFEVRSPADAKAGQVDLPGFALYYVCEDVNGTCLYRRQDMTIPIRVKP